MKKIFTIVMTISSAIVFQACKEEKQEDITNETPLAQVFLRSKVT